MPAALKRCITTARPTCVSRQTTDSAAVVGQRDRAVAGRRFAGHADLAAERRCRRCRSGASARRRRCPTITAKAPLSIHRHAGIVMGARGSVLTRNSTASIALPSALKRRAKMPSPSPGPLPSQTTMKLPLASIATRAVELVAAAGRVDAELGAVAHCRRPRSGAHRRSGRAVLVGAGPGDDETAADVDRDRGPELVTRRWSG